MAFVAAAEFVYPYVEALLPYVSESAARAIQSATFAPYESFADGIGLYLVDRWPVAALVDLQTAGLATTAGLIELANGETGQFFSGRSVLMKV